jgi:MoxR-like ATPase
MTRIATLRRSPWLTRPPAAPTTMGELRDAKPPFSVESTMNRDAARELQHCYEEIQRLIRRDIVGLDEVIKLLVAGIFADGHCLLVGVPGLAKTRLIATLARLLDLDFSRIQFTPDLMPNDITGAEVIVEDKVTGERRFEFLKGPIFANVILADEINRTPPKTQASLMEAMEERQVSSLGKRFPLEAPFFVLATQNPIEQEGTYPLPAAQLDRFLFSIDVDYPTRDNEAEIVRLLTQDESAPVEPVLNREKAIEIFDAVRRVEASDDVVRYATKIARASRPDDEHAPEVVKTYFSFGAGPRAAQGLVMGAKALSMMRGDGVPTAADVRELVGPVLRHRVVLNFLGSADAVSVDDMLETLVASIPAPDGWEAKAPESPGLFARLAAALRR